MTVIDIDGVSKQYRLGVTHSGSLSQNMEARLRNLLRLKGREAVPSRYEEFWALRDISLRIEEGEAFGLIGRNGAGKSTLLKILARITLPTEGRISITGRVGSLLEIGTGFHPELTGRENVFLNGAVLGMRRQEIIRRFDEIVEFSGISRFIDTPVKRYSSGMYVRLAFSVAAHLEPEVLIIDEVLAVGDAEFQRKCLERMDNVAQSGRTIIFVSHGLTAVQKLCDRVAWIEKGRVVELGTSQQVIRAYLKRDTEEGPVGEAAIPADAVRHGEGEVQLRHLRMLDASGGLTDRIDLGEPFTLELTFEALDPIEGGAISVWLSAADGTRFAVAVNVDDGWPTVRWEKGTHKVRVTILDATILPGEYCIDVGIQNGKYVFDFVERVIEFTGTSVPYGDTVAYPWTSGIAHLRVPSRWSFEDSGSAGQSSLSADELQAPS